MQVVTITLNQKVVSAHAGMTVLEIARESGINIPTLCHSPYLKSVGACRLCLVENEAKGTLLASCVTEVTPGMEINTHSPKVLEFRRNVLELMLASHPDSCLVCDQGNRCQLRQLAADLGIGYSEKEKIHRFAEIEEVNPFIVRDSSKCVMCAKCIRVCQEVVVEGVLDYFQRGFASKPATFLNVPLEDSECTFCGACIALCPTGALQEGKAPYQGASSIAVETTCPFCSSGCPLSLEVKGERIVRAAPGGGDTSVPGTLCVRGSYGVDFVHSRERLLSPMVNENGSYKEVTWEEAIRTAADGLKRIMEKYGKKSLGVLGSPCCTNEENYLLQRFARTVLGDNQINNSSSFFLETLHLGLGEVAGCYTATSSIDTLEQADLILVVGTDPTTIAPQVGYAIKRASRLGEAKIIFIYPRKSRFTEFASQWVCPHPFSYAWLLNSMAQVIIEEGLLNREYVGRHTEKFAALSEALKDFSPEGGKNIAGVTEEEIRRASRLYAAADKSAIVFGPEITGAFNGRESVKALANLALLTGNLWGKGCGIYPLPASNNSQGAAEMGVMPHMLPGYLSVEEANSRKIFENLWGQELSREKGWSALEVFAKEENYPWKGMYIMGDNPVRSFSSPQKARAVLSNLEFLVVQDLYFTESASFANVILPAASFAEKEGSFTNLDGNIGWLRRVLPPAGQSLPDWKIILKLAQEMGNPFPYNSLQQVINEIEEFVPLYEGYDMPEERLGEGKAYWEERKNQSLQYMHKFPTFSLPSMSAFTHEERNLGESYPYCLFLEGSLTYFGSGTRSEQSTRLKALYPRGVLKIAPEDADDLSLENQDEVKITSTSAAIKLPVEITTEVLAGTVSVSAFIPEARELLAPVSVVEEKEALPEAVFVKLERVNRDD